MENSLINSLNLELEMQTRSYDLAVKQTTEFLRGYEGRKPSTHLGHNLANRATDLAALAAKIEQTENMIRWAREAK